MYYVHKDTVSKCVKNKSQEEIDKLIQDGWLPGKCPAHWITDGSADKLLKEGLPI